MTTQRHQLLTVLHAIISSLKCYGVPWCRVQIGMAKKAKFDSEACQGVRRRDIFQIWSLILSPHSGCVLEEFFQCLVTLVLLQTHNESQMGKV